MGAADKLLKQFNTRESRYFKPTPGEKQYVRLLPPYPLEYGRKAEKLGAVMDPRLGIVVCHVHAFLPKLNPSKEEVERAQKYGQNDGIPVTNYRCLRDLRKPCPFCQFFDNLPKEDKELKYEHGCKANAWADFYIKATGSCQRWFLPKTVLERIGQIFDILPNLNHPKKGQNLIITRRGSGLKTKYEVEVSKKITPLPVDEDQFPGDVLEELDNFTVVPGPKAVNKILKLKFPDLL